MPKDQELIWVDKDFAEKWKTLTAEKTTEEEREKVFDEYLNRVTEKTRTAFKCDLESIEEDAAIFKGLLLKTRQVFEKAKNEHLEAAYTLWEKFEEEIPSTQEKTDKILKILEPLVKQLNAINELLRKINTHDLDRFNKSLSVLSNAYGKNREMIEFLVKHFGKEGNINV